MVKRKKKAASSNKTVGENEAVENALAETKTSDSVTVNVEESVVDAQVKDNVELTAEEVKNGEHEKINSEEGSGKHEGTNNEEGEKAMEVDNDEDTITTKMNGDNTAAHQNTSEDDEADDLEEVMWEDDEEDSEEDYEENVADEDEFSDEHATEEEGYDDEDELSEEATEEDDEGNTEKEKGIAEGDGEKAEEHNTEKVELTLKSIEKSKERSTKKKVRAESSKKAERGDKPESSSKRKTKKRVESMGMIFICSSKTKNDCYQYRVLGLPETKKDMVRKIYTGMRLFLYDVDLKLMYGIYKAAGPGGYNIEPKAFKSQFPSQVRFKVLDDCLPLPEEKFKKVIKENYYTNTKFDCILTSEQVKKLCKLFISSSKRQKPKKLGRSRKAEKLHPVRRERARRPRPADERRLPLREERVYRERPRKRPRKAITPLPPPRRPLTPPLPSTARSYAYERTLDVDAHRREPYLERRSPYRDGRGPLLKRHDPYLERRSPYRDRDLLSSRRDPYPERRYAYRDDPYVERRDVYRDGRDDPYPERRRDYRDGRDSYLESRDPLRDGRDSYVEHRGVYGPHSETYSSYRRDPISDHRDVYREDQGFEYRDSYRRDIQPLSLQTRRENEIGTRDSYISYRERPSYFESIYSAEYPSRVGLPREYHL
ncbi:hypothetical protein BUALT_Bualt02G0064100 [Buddleja alternifolia]|uniref:DCD domain-containing protein n=1 Tax=Buddleja alternifolia TaxID=168488 RepID=A0AAV6Y8T6_9LAMI|nr:hypothetical protein BUALT_Bualt02G0064100 [Buddleja alternifolia]